MTSTPPIVREIVYHADASQLFDYLGGTAQDYSALLESADATTHSGLHSLGVLGASAVLTCAGSAVTATALNERGQAVLREAGIAAHHSYPPAGPETTDEAARLTAASSIEPLRALQQAGHLLVGGFAFDYLASFEDLPDVGEGPNRYPDYQFLLAEVVLRINHQERSAELIGAAELSDELDRLAAAAARLGEAQADAADADATSESPEERTTDSTTEPTASRTRVTATASLTDTQFRAGVREFQTHIHCGDIYQAVPSRRFSIACPDAFAAYRELRAANPSPYMFYLRGRAADGEPFELFGASPESNLKYTARDRAVRLYPIAGTRPRGATSEMDIRNELTLRTDAKELAEHTMLVDLARNDVARVSEPGTRRVDRLMAVERYSAVMHLVSEVSGTLREGLDALDAFRACMTMGTLTGAPKLKAAELIRVFEHERRGSFGGAIGYLRGDGDMDTCVVIRSAFVRRGEAVVQAGAGVVRDSVPQSEADETLHKAWAVLSAIAQASNATLEVVR